jgi:hypothetical protein
VPANGKVTQIPRPKSGGEEFREMGVGFNLPWGRESLWTDQDLVPVDKLIKMHRESGQARALMRILTIPGLATVADSEWIAREDQEDMPEEVELLNNVFRQPKHAGGMDVPFSRVMRQIMMALLTGYQAFEKVWHIPTEGPLKGKITLKKLAHRDPRTLRFLTTDRGEFDGLHQTASVGGKTIDIDIPKDKCFYFAVNEDENPYYGVSYFNAGWYHWDKVMKMYFLAHIRAQMSAVPVRIGKEPANATREQRLEFRNAVKNIGLNSGLVLPDNFEVSFHNIGAAGFDYEEYVNHHLLQMSRSVMAAFLDKNDRQVLIDHGSQAADDMFILALEALLDDIAVLITNEIVPQIIDWNIGSGRYPVFRFGEIADSTRDLLKEVFNSVMVSTSPHTTPEFMRELERKMAKRLAMDIDYDAVAEREAQEAEEAKKAEEEAAKAVKLGLAPAPGLPSAPPKGPAPTPPLPPPAKVIPPPLKKPAAKATLPTA